MFEEFEEFEELKGSMPAAFIGFKACGVQMPAAFEEFRCLRCF